MVRARPLVVFVTLPLFHTASFACTGSERPEPVIEDRPILNAAGHHDFATELDDFRESMRRLVLEGDLALSSARREALVASHADVDADLEKLQSLRDRGTRLDAELLALNEDARPHWPEVRRSLATRVHRFARDVDDVELRARADFQAFADVVLAQLSEVDGSFGNLTRKDPRGVPGFDGSREAQLRRLGTHRDAIRAEVAFLSRGVENGVIRGLAQERRKLTDRLLLLRWEIRELEYEMRWESVVDSVDP